MVLPVLASLLLMSASTQRDERFVYPRPSLMDVLRETTVVTLRPLQPRGVERWILLGAGAAMTATLFFDAIFFDAPLGFRAKATD